MRWRCAWCGREFDSEDPPCETCGHERFERIAEDAASPFESGALVWACTNCGREHVKHSPPCSRCGNYDLEKRDAGAVDLTEDVSTPSYLSVGKPYLVGIAVVVAFVVLAAVGVLPGFDSGPPDPPNAPGDGDQYAGLDLAVVEAELHERFQTERGADATRVRDSGLDAFAEYETRHRVAERYDPSYDGSVPELVAFDPRCESAPVFGIAELSIDLVGYDDEPAAADALAETLLGDESYREAVLKSGSVEGIDVHVGPDGTVFVGYAVC